MRTLNEVRRDGPLPFPVDLEAERAVIGCALASPAGARLAASRLGPEDFYRPHHQHVFEAVLAPEVDIAWGSAEPGGGLVDRLAAVQSRLERLGLEHYGEPEWLRRIVDESPVAVDLNGKYAARVADTARWRRIMSAAAVIHICASEADMDAVRSGVASLMAVVDGAE